jgi:molecular chaperone GrpE
MENKNDVINEQEERLEASEGGTPPEEAQPNTGDAASEAERKCQEYLELVQRVQADFENYKRRNANARAEAHQQGLCAAVAAFLPVVDNLERAVAAAEEDGSNPLLEGVQMVHKQMLEALQALGVEEIPALGEPFDPNLHEAVMRAEAECPEQAGRVTGVMRKGYCVDGRVLRYAMVTVAQ